MGRQTSVIRESDPELTIMRKRLEQAWDTMKRLPRGDHPRTVKSGMPQIVRQFWEAYGHEAANFNRGAPDPRAIDDLSAVSDLVIRALNVEERRLVWARAMGTPWKILQRLLNCDRGTVWRTWTLAIMKLVACAKGRLLEVENNTIKDNTPRVYAIRAKGSGAIKIGFSYDPPARMAQMQTGIPEKLELLGACYGWMTQERALHAHLHEYRINGEWFKPEGLVIAAIEKIKECAHADEVLQHLENLRTNEIRARWSVGGPRRVA